MTSIPTRVDDISPDNFTAAFAGTVRSQEEIAVDNFNRAYADFRQRQRRARFATKPLRDRCRLIALGYQA